MNWRQYIRKVALQDRVMKGISGLFLATLLVKLAGYAEKVIVAYYWGTGIEVDIYHAVFAIITSVFLLTREIIEPGFLTTFIKLRTGDQEKAWGFFRFLATLIFVVSGLIVLAGIAFPETVVTVFLPGFTAEKREIAVRFVQISFAAVLFYNLSALSNLALNAMKKFFYPSVGDLALKAALILAVLALADDLGIYSVAIGILAGCCLRLLIQLFQLRKYLRFGLWKREHQYPTVLRHSFLPVFIGVLCSQVLLLINNVWVSYMNDGDLAAIGYAIKLVDLPVVLISYTVSVVAYPFLAEMAANGKITERNILFRQSTSILLKIFLPLSIFFLFFGREIIETVYARGLFDDAAVTQTFQPFVIYSVAMVPMALESVFVIYFFSAGNMLIPVVTGIACSILSLLISYFLIGNLGYLAIPIGYSLSRIVKLLILLVLTRDQQFFSFARTVRMILVLAVFSLFVFKMKTFLLSGGGHIFWQLAGAFGFALGSYLILLFLAGMLRSPQVLAKENTLVKRTR